MNYESYKVKSVEKALKMIRLFTHRTPELKLNEISSLMGIHKSSAHRIAVTLVAGGFLRWNAGRGTYSLGLKILELSGVLVSTLEIRSQVRPNLEKLHQSTGEMVHLGVLDEGEVVYIDKMESKKGVTLYSDIGKRAPCHCTGLGKALLSGLPNEKVSYILKEKGMKCFTSNTIVNFNEFIKHLDEIRENGYALDLEEHESMVYCVAVPIRDYTGACVAAISVTCIAKNYFANELLDKYKTLLLKTGAAISSELGFAEQSD